MPASIPPPGSFTGFDVVLVTGEANAVGVSTGTSALDDTSLLPVFALSEGRVDAPLQFSSPWVVPMNEAVQHSPTTFNEGGANSIASGFAMQYIADGFLKPGRAILVVNAAKVGSPLGFTTGATSPTLSPANSLIELTWSPSVACDTSFAEAQFVTDFMAGGLRMNLHTHAAYRLRLALAVNPATSLNTSASMTPNAQNKFITVLWHQGETDLAHGTGSDHYGVCVSDMVNTLRNQFTPQAGDSYSTMLAFGAGGYPMGVPQTPLLSEYNVYHMFNLGHGRYEQTFPSQTGLPFQNFSVSPNFMNVTYGRLKIFYADSSYTYSGTHTPLGGGSTTFSAADTHVMGVRYAEAFRFASGNPRKLKPAPRKPQMGWRDYQYYYGNTNQSLVMAVINQLSRRDVPWMPAGTSLCDLGYCDAGIDSGEWQICQNECSSPQGTVACNTTLNPWNSHTRAGNWQIDTTYFPDMSQVSAYAHARNITVGLYFGSCKCNAFGNDRLDANFASLDMQLFNNMGFDNLKVDGCSSSERNKMEWFYRFMPDDTILEDCNDGGSPYYFTGYGMDAQLRNQAYLGILDANGEPYFPMNIYRTSNDMLESFVVSYTYMGQLQQRGVYGNLMAMTHAAEYNLSTPILWGYGDMLMLTGTPYDDGMPQGRAKVQFYGWCIHSSPLILGMDIIDANRITPYVPIFTNTEAIAVDQQYFGFSGSIYPVTQSTLSNGNGTFFHKPMSWDNSSVAVLAINSGLENNVSGTFVFSEVPYLRESTSVSVRDIHAHTDMGAHQGSYTFTNLGYQDCIFLILRAL